MSDGKSRIPKEVMMNEVIESSVTKGTELWQLTAHGKILCCVVKGISKNEAGKTVLDLSRTDVAGNKKKDIQIVEKAENRKVSARVFRWLSDAVSRIVEDAEKRIGKADRVADLIDSKDRYSDAIKHVEAWDDRTRVSSK